MALEDLELLLHYQCWKYGAKIYAVMINIDWCIQGVAGLSARDIKLIVDGGFNTVESVAYTLVKPRI